MLLNELLSLVSSHFFDKLECSLFFEVAFLQGKHRLFKSDLIILIAINDVLGLVENRGHLHFWKYLDFDTDCLTKAKSASFLTLSFFSDHSEHQLVVFLFFGIMCLKVWNSVGSDLNWNCESILAHGTNIVNRHFEIFVNLVGHTDEMDARLIILASIVFQRDFDEDSLSSSSLNDFLWNLDNSALVNSHALSILTMVSLTVLEVWTSHPFLHIGIMTLWVLSLI